MKIIDTFLNQITMYRLLLYYLLGLLTISFVLSFFHVLPFTPFALLLSTLYLIAISWISNTVFAKIFRVPTNVESVYISALIFALIITPSAGWGFLTWAAILGIASKYILSLNKKHIFNPVAFGVYAAGIGLSQYASWWVGTPSLMIPVLLGGLLIVRKIRREDMVFSFFVIALTTVFGFSMLSHTNFLTTLQKLFIETPFFFFAFVMLTEPLTTPPTQQLQVIYGGLVGFLFNPQVHLGSLYSTPELALLVGNIYSYLVSPKVRLLLTLQGKVQVAPDIYDFIFSHTQKFSFVPGQYLEWTLAHPSPDARGNRRYFTIASSPTEKELIMGVRFNPKGSSFKQTLGNLKLGDEIIAGQLAGDFTLPKDTTKKLAFIAGGIGVTPFRSMVKYLLDSKEKRDVVLLYTAKTVRDFAYKGVFDQASKTLSIPVIYTLTDTTQVPTDWKGETGRITGEMIQKDIPDFAERLWYLSGPNSMVESYEKLLLSIGTPQKHIKKDYFPGF